MDNPRGVSSYHVLLWAFGDAYMRRENVRHATFLLRSTAACLWKLERRKVSADMTTEALVAEKWKELESTVHLSFPNWNGRECERFLKDMRVEGVDFTRLMALRMARNALTHNPLLNGRPIVSLNEDVIPFLDDVIAKIRQLPTATTVLIPRNEVYCGSMESRIRDVVAVMLEKVYSHVPILDSNDKVIGVFSESTMLEMNKAGIGNGESLTMRDIDAYLPQEKHVAEVFRFVPKNDPIAHLRQLCTEALSRHERIGMFFVTENGAVEEPLLGILTVWDIAGVSDLCGHLPMAGERLR